MNFEGLFRFQFKQYYPIRIIPILLSLVYIVSCSPIINHKSNIPSHSVKSSDKTRIELFVMSQCPYGVEAEKAIIPIIKEFRYQIIFHLNYIAEEIGEENRKKPHQPTIEEIDSLKMSDPVEMMEQCEGEAVYEGGRFKSLHGIEEIDENIRQLVMAKYYPVRFLDYLLLRSENYHTDNWEQAATSAWIDCDRVKMLVQSEGEDLLGKNIQKARELQIFASPTLLLNGEKIKGPITYNAILRNLCWETYQPEKCQKIPICSNDFDCSVEGKVGVCLNPDTNNARCQFTDPVQVKLKVIRASDCSFCDHTSFLEWTKKMFPGVQEVEINPNSPQAEALIRHYSLQTLPAFLFDSNIQKTARYLKIKNMLQPQKGIFFLAKDQIKVSFFIHRPIKKESFSFFTEGFSPLGLKAAQELIQTGLTKSATFRFHPLAQVVNQEKPKAQIMNLVPSGDNNLILTPSKPKVTFQASGGLKEVQEDIRQLCIFRHFSNQYISYLECISNLSITQIKGRDWQNCLKKIKLEEKHLKSCTHGREGVDLLLKEIDLANKLGIKKGPAYLINNKILIRDAPPNFASYLYQKINSKKLNQ